jgi:hypothetical protein
MVKSVGQGKFLRVRIHRWKITERWEFQPLPQLLPVVQQDRVERRPVLY